MRDIHLRFSIDRGPCQRYRLSLVFCVRLPVTIPKGDMDLAYKISPMYRESQQQHTSRAADRDRPPRRGEEASVEGADGKARSEDLYLTQDYALQYGKTDILSPMAHHCVAEG